MIEVYQLTKTLEKLMTRLDRTIEQNDELLQQSNNKAKVEYSTHSFEDINVINFPE
jgi:hypothetical protein